MSSFFITGTGTGVGKTFCSVLLAKKHGMQYYKPIQCGLVDADADMVAENGITIVPSTYVLKTPSSPHFAAEIDQITIDISMLQKDFDSPTIVEGAGGVMVPINSKEFMVDIIKYFSLPTLIVASGRLGTINHTLLTIEALRARRIDIAGVIINGIVDFDNVEAIKYYGNVDIISI